MRRTNLILILTFVLSLLVSACSPVAQGFEGDFVLGLETKHPNAEVAKVAKDFMLEGGVTYTLVIEGETEKVLVKYTPDHGQGITMNGQVFKGDLPYEEFYAWASLTQGDIPEVYKTHGRFTTNGNGSEFHTLQLFAVAWDSPFTDDRFYDVYQAHHVNPDLQ
jgi:predicted small secreted protein